MELTAEEKKKNKKILGLLFIGVLMGALDISIVGPAIPAIEKTINVDPRSIGWIFSIYVLFNLSSIPLFAKLSDKFGRQSIYITAVSIFAIGSLVVSFAGDFSWLLVGRAIQGFGSGGIFPVASAVIGDVIPAEKRGSALGMIGAVFGLAFVLGPIIAGVLLMYFTWHSLFTINLPIAFFIILGSLKLLPTHRIDTGKKIDLAGIILLGSLLASFAYGLNRMKASSDILMSFLTPEVYIFLSISLILALVFIYVERTVQTPIVKLNMFKNRQVRMVGLIAMGTGFFQSSVVFIPNFTVGAFNVEISKASFMLLPIVAFTAVGSPLAGMLLDKWGSKKTAFLGLVLAAIGELVLGLTDNSLTQFYIAGAIVGLGTSIMMGPTLRYIMLNEAGASDRASTQGLLTIFISVGQIIGSAIISAIIASESIKTMGYKKSFLILSGFIALLTIAASLLKNRRQELNALGINKS